MPRVRKRTRLLALEPRMMFDGALVAGTAATVSHVAAIAAPDHVVDASVAADAHPAATEKSSVTPAATSALSSAAQKTLVFIDESVPNYQTVAANVAPGASVILIAPDTDGIALITQTLAAEAGDVASIQIVSHATPGQLLLGNRTVDLAALSGSLSAQVGSWRSALAPGADILVLGCDLAQGTGGQAFVNTLARLTGAAVGASSNATGPGGLGGDWNLEYSTGTLNTGIALTAAAEAAVTGDLTAAPTATLAAASANVLIGSSFTFEVDFSNPGPSIGYGPYVDLFLPTTGKDGSDGITFSSASYLSTPLAATVLTFDSHGNATHPFYKDTNGNAVVIHAATYGGRAGDELAVIELPFGGFSPSQPTVPITVTATISNLAPIAPGGDLLIKASAGFRFGLTPGADYATDPSIISAVTGQEQINPQLYIVNTTFNRPQGETATGPDFPDAFTTTVTIAPGQTLSNLVVTQNLPNAIDFLSASGTSGHATSLPIVGTPSNAETLTWNFGNASGTVSFTTNFYVPQFDANAAPVLDPVTGAPVIMGVGTTSSADWTPLNPLEPTQTITESNPTAASFQAKSMTTYKTVTDLSGGTYQPGDTVQYSMTTAVSDYFSLGTLAINDTMSDGLAFNSGSATISFTGHNNAALGSAAMGAGDLNVVVNPDGTSTLVFDLSAAQSLLPGSGSAFGSAPGDPVKAVISYTANLLTSYRNPSAPSTLNTVGVKETDPLSNYELASGVLSGSSVVTDSSTANFNVGRGAFTLTIDAVDARAATPSTPVTPGAAVTYEMTYTFQANSFNSLILTSFLPLPIFTSSYGWTADASGNPTPAIGEYQLGVTTSPAISVAGVTVDAAANSVSFNFQNLTTAVTTTQKIDILYTVQASATKYANGLLLTNLGEQSAVNSKATNYVAQALVQVTRVEPVLAIVEGVVSTDNVNAALTTAAGGGVTWAAAGSAGSPFTGTVTDAALTAAPINANASGIDAGDTVRFAITVQNTGGSGAFNVGISDQLPASFVPAGSLVPGANIHFNVVNGAGTRLGVTDSSGVVIMDANGNYQNGNTQATLLAALQSVAGIRLLDPGATTAALAAAGSAPGTDIAVITFDLVASAATQPKEVDTSTVTLRNYSGTSSSPNYAPSSPLLTDLATVTAAGATVSKTLVSTDQAFTSGSNVAIGEVATYQVVITIPEGTSSNAGGVIFTDSLASGLAFVGINSITTSAALGTDVAGGFAAVATPTSIGSNGSSFTLNFGTITNSDRNNSVPETITIQYSAVVLNTLTNRAGTRLANNAGWTTTYNRATGSTTVTIQEAALGISVTPSASSGQAYDTITYTVRVTNSGQTDGFDINVIDSLPTGLTNMANVTVATTGSGIGAVTGSTDGSTLTGTIADLPVGGIVTYTFTAQLLPGVGFGQVITDTATTTWTSMPGAYAAPTAYPANTERTGAGGPGANNVVLNNYSRSGSGNVTVFTAAPQLTETTSEAATPDGTPQGPGYITGNVAIGEIVRYRLLVDIPQSTTNNLSLQDTLPAGMQLLNDGTAMLAFVSSTGNAITSSDPGLAGAGLAGTQSTINSLHPSFLIPASNISVSGSNTTVSTITLNLGTVVNGDNNPANAEFVLVEFNAIVNNAISGASALNKAGNTLASSFKVLSSATAVATSNTASELVVEPLISNLAEQVTAINGSTVTYKITFSNAGNSAANSSTAFESELTDPITSSNLSNISNVNVVLGGGAAGVTDLSTASKLDVLIGSIPYNGTVTVTYTAQVASVNQVASDTASLTWTSLLGSGTAFAGSTQGASGSATGERTGGVTPTLGAVPNTYYRTVSTVLGVVQGTVWNDIMANLAPINVSGAPLAGQPLLAGVPLDLTGTLGGAPLSLMTTTDSHGNYSFGILPAGTYTIKVDPAWTGLVANGGVYSGVSPSSNSTVLTVSSASTSTVNFGERSLNNAPSLSGLSNGATYSVGSVPAVIDSNVLINDPDLSGAVINNNYGGTVFTLARQGGANASDVFTASGLLGALTQGAALTYNGIAVGTVTTNSGGTLGLTFANAVPQATVSAVVQAIAFQTSSSNPPTSITLGYTFNDGNPANPNGRQGTGGALSATGTVTLNRVNVAPVISGMPLTPDSFTEGGTPTVLAPAGTVQDLDLAGINNWNGATLTLARHGAANAEDVFSLTGTASFSGGTIVVGGTTIATFTQTGGVLAIQFNGNATSALVNTLMKDIAYSNSNANPPASAQIDYVLNDGNAGNAVVPGPQGLGGPLSANANVQITIHPVDNPPSNTLPASTALLDTQSYPFTGPNTVSIADVDANLGTVSSTLTVMHGTLSATVTAGASLSGGGTGTLVISGTVAQVNATLASLVYTPQFNFTGTPVISDTLTIATNDNGNTGQMPASLPAGSVFGNGGTSIVTTNASPITLTHHNTAPSVTDLGDGIKVVPGAAPVDLAPNALAHDHEMDAFASGAGDYTGATLTLSRAGGAVASDLFGVDPNSTVSLAGGTISVAGVAIGTVVQSGGVAQFAFNASATSARVDSFLAAITYQNSGATSTGSISILYLINDGNTGLQGAGGALTGSGTVKVTFGAPVIPIPPPVPPGGAATHPPYYSIGFADFQLSNQLKTITWDGSTSGGSSIPPRLESTRFGWPADSEQAGGVIQDLLLGEQIEPQTFAIGREFVFMIPRNAFLRTNPRAIVNLIAMRVDGEPLPGWLSFDDISGVFSGTPPRNAAALDILVIARDDQGHEQQQTFRLNFTPADRAQQGDARIEARLARSHDTQAPMRVHPAAATVRTAAPTFAQQLRAARAHSL